MAPFSQLLERGARAKYTDPALLAGWLSQLQRHGEASWLVDLERGKKTATALLAEDPCWEEVAALAAASADRASAMQSGDGNSLFGLWARALLLDATRPRGLNVMLEQPVEKREGIASVLAYAAAWHLYATQQAAATAPGGANAPRSNWPYEEECWEPLIAALSVPHQISLFNDVLNALLCTPHALEETATKHPQLASVLPPGIDGAQPAFSSIETPLHAAALVSLCQIAGITAAEEARGAAPPWGLLLSRGARALGDRWMARPEFFKGLGGERERSDAIGGVGLLLVKPGASADEAMESVQRLRDLERHALLAVPAAGHLSTALDAPMEEALSRILASALGPSGGGAPPLRALLERAAAAAGLGGSWQPAGGAASSEPEPWGGEDNASDGDGGSRGSGTGGAGDAAGVGVPPCDLTALVDVLMGGLVSQLRRDAFTTRASPQKAASTLLTLDRWRQSLVTRLLASPGDAAGDADAVLQAVSGFLCELRQGREDVAAGGAAAAAEGEGALLRPPELTPAEQPPPAVQPPAAWETESWERLIWRVDALVERCRGLELLLRADCREDYTLSDTEKAAVMKHADELRDLCTFARLLSDVLADTVKTVHAASQRAAADRSRDAQHRATAARALRRAARLLWWLERARAGQEFLRFASVRAERSPRPEWDEASSSKHPLADAVRARRPGGAAGCFALRRRHSPALGVGFGGGLEDDVMRLRGGARTAASVEEASSYESTEEDDWPTADEDTHAEIGGGDATAGPEAIWQPPEQWRREEEQEESRAAFSAAGGSRRRAGAGGEDTTAAAIADLSTFPARAASAAGNSAYDDPQDEFSDHMVTPNGGNPSADIDGAWQDRSATGSEDTSPTGGGSFREYPYEIRQQLAALGVTDWPEDEGSPRPPPEEAETEGSISSESPLAGRMRQMRARWAAHAGEEEEGEEEGEPHTLLGEAGGVFDQGIDLGAAFDADSLWLDEGMNLSDEDLDLDAIEATRILSEAAAGPSLPAAGSRQGSAGGRIVRRAVRSSAAAAAASPDPYDSISSESDTGEAAIERFRRQFLDSFGQSGEGTGDVFAGLWEDGGSSGKSMSGAARRRVRRECARALARAAKAASGDDGGAGGGVDPMAWVQAVGAQVGAGSTERQAAEIIGAVAPIVLLCAWSTPAGGISGSVSSATAAALDLIWADHDEGFAPAAAAAAASGDEALRPVWDLAGALWRRWLRATGRGCRDSGSGGEAPPVLSPGEELEWVMAAVRADLNATSRFSRVQAMQYQRRICSLSCISTAAAAGGGGGAAAAAAGGGGGGAAAAAAALSDAEVEAIVQRLAADGHNGGNAAATTAAPWCASVARRLLELSEASGLVAFGGRAEKTATATLKDMVVKAGRQPPAAAQRGGSSSGGGAGAKDPSTGAEVSAVVAPALEVLQLVEAVTADMRQAQSVVDPFIKLLNGEVATLHLLLVEFTHLYCDNLAALFPLSGRTGEAPRRLLEAQLALTKAHPVQPWSRPAVDLRNALRDLLEPASVLYAAAVKRLTDVWKKCAGKPGLADACAAIPLAPPFRRAMARAFLLGTERVKIPPWWGTPQILAYLEAHRAGDGVTPGAPEGPGQALMPVPGNKLLFKCVDQISTRSATAWPLQPLPGDPDCPNDDASDWECCRSVASDCDDALGELAPWGAALEAFPLQAYMEPLGWEGSSSNGGLDGKEGEEEGGSLGTWPAKEGPAMVALLRRWQTAQKAAAEPRACAAAAAAGAPAGVSGSDDGAAAAACTGDRQSTAAAAAAAAARGGRGGGGGGGGGGSGGGCGNPDKAAYLTFGIPRKDLHLFAPRNPRQEVFQSVSEVHGASLYAKAVQEAFGSVYETATAERLVGHRGLRPPPGAALRVVAPAADGGPGRDWRLGLQVEAIAAGRLLIAMEWALNLVARGGGTPDADAAAVEAVAEAMRKTLGISRDDLDFVLTQMRGGIHDKARSLLSDALSAVRPTALQWHLANWELPSLTAAAGTEGAMPIFQAASSLARGLLRAPPAYQDLLGTIAADGARRGAGASMLRRQYGRAAEMSMSQALTNDDISCAALRLQVLRAVLAAHLDSGKGDALAELAINPSSPGPLWLRDGADAAIAASRLGLQSPWVPAPPQGPPRQPMTEAEHLYSDICTVVMGQIEGCFQDAVALAVSEANARGRAGDAPHAALTSRLGQRISQQMQEELEYQWDEMHLPRGPAARGITPQNAIAFVDRLLDQAARAGADVSQLPEFEQMIERAVRRAQEAAYSALAREFLPQAQQLMLQAGWVTDTATQGKWCALAAGFHAHVAAALHIQGGPQEVNPVVAILAMDTAVTHLGGPTVTAAAPWFGASHLLSRSSRGAAAPAGEGSSGRRSSRGGGPDDGACDWCGAQRPPAGGGAGCGACGCARYCGAPCASAAAPVHGPNCRRLKALSAKGAALRPISDWDRPVLDFAVADRASGGGAANGSAAKQAQA